MKDEKPDDEKLKNSKIETKSSTTLPVIKCFCGAEILLMPNVKVMSEAIEAHIERKHKSKVHNLTEDESEKIREYLITQVFDEARKT